MYVTAALECCLPQHLLLDVLLKVFVFFCPPLPQFGQGRWSCWPGSCAPLIVFLKFWLLKICVRGPFGVRASFARGAFGVRLGSVWDPFRIRAGSVRGSFGMRSSGVRGSFGTRKPPQPKKNCNPGGLRGGRYRPPPPNGRYGFMVQTGLPYNWACL